VAAAVTQSALSRRVAGAWLVLLVLLVAIAILESGSWLATAPPERTGRVPVFRFTERDLGAVEVTWRGRAASLVREASGQWLRHDASHRHQDGSRDHVADPQAAETIAEQLAVTARMLADRRIVPERELDAYGLAKPELVIAFYARGDAGPAYARPLAVLYVGDLLPTRYAYYTLLDGEDEITLIPRYQIALLLALLFGEDEAPSPLPAPGEARAYRIFQG
jgi:hypothetical protein